MKQPMIDTMTREKYDDLYTPERAVYPIARYIRSSIFSPNKKTIIWECCDGGFSRITNVFKNSGFEVVSTSITTGTDFLTCQITFDFDIIVTNPPYSLKDEFLERCYTIGKPFALLLPLTTLEGIKRGEMFKRYGINLLVLDRRLDFTGKKSNWFNASWFYWKLNQSPFNIVSFVSI